MKVQIHLNQLMVFVPIWCVCSRRGKGEEAKRDVIKEREGREMDTDKRPPIGKSLRGIPERMGYQHRRAVVIGTLIIDDKRKKHSHSQIVCTC